MNVPRGGRPSRAFVGVVLVSLLVLPLVPLGAWPVPDTGSMEPTMSGCDVVVYGPADTVEAGDVVLAEATWREGAVLHRVVDETPEGYILQGDANASPDPSVVPAAAVMAESHYVIATGAAIGPLCGPLTDVGIRTYESLVGVPPR